MRTTQVERVNERCPEGICARNCNTGEVARDWIKLHNLMRSFVG